MKEMECNCSHFLQFQKNKFIFHRCWSTCLITRLEHFNMWVQSIANNFKLHKVFTDSTVYDIQRHIVIREAGVLDRLYLKTIFAFL